MGMPSNSESFFCTSMIFSACCRRCCKRATLRSSASFPTTTGSLPFGPRRWARPAAAPLRYYRRKHAVTSPACVQASASSTIRVLKSAENWHRCGLAGTPAEGTRPGTATPLPLSLRLADSDDIPLSCTRLSLLIYTTSSPPCSVNCGRQVSHSILADRVEQRNPISTTGWPEARQLPPAPTERSVRISRTTLFRGCSQHSYSS